MTGKYTNDLPKPHSGNSSDVDDKERLLLPSEEDKNKLFTIRIYKTFKFDIFKPLVPLKLSLFLWFGAGAMIHPFLPLYLKQRGLALSELSTIYIITPIVQLLGVIISGLIADKIGRAKPILVGSLLLSQIFLLGIFIAPSLKTMREARKFKIRLMCHQHRYNKVIGKADCILSDSAFLLNSCAQTSCKDNISINFDERMPMQTYGSAIIQLSNDPPLSNDRYSYKESNECYYNIDFVTPVNLTFSWCDLHDTSFCSIHCSLVAENKSSYQRTSLLIVVFTFMILYLVTHSSTYRFLDVTAMCLVKDYGKDFGRERIWANLGVILFSASSGWIVELTSSDNEKGPRNYDVAFYLFWILSLMSLLCLWSLEVCIYPPGQRMWRKSLTLLGNLEVLSFIVILLVLGTSWGFFSIYTSWYLEDLHASSLLLGLAPAVVSLSGLPFLHTSKWWVRRIGSHNIFLLALVASTINSLGLSFIRNPWWAIITAHTTIFSYVLLWVAVVVHSHSLAPEGLRATLISTAGGIHFGVGKGTGSLIGGLTMAAYGGRTAFRIMASMSLTTAVLYSIYLFIRKRLKPMPIIDRGKGTGSLLGGLIMGAYGGRTAFRIIGYMCFTTAVLYSMYLLIRRQLKSWGASKKERSITYTKLEDLASEEDTKIMFDAE